MFGLVNNEISLLLDNKIEEQYLTDVDMNIFTNKRIIIQGSDYLFKLKS